MDISIEKGSWKTLEHPVSAVRLMVFVAEQKVPKEEEIDALDPVSTHFVARDSRHMVVGTARLTPDGRSSEAFPGTRRRREAPRSCA